MPHRRRDRLRTAGCCLLSATALVACAGDDRVASEPAAPVAATPTSAPPSTPPTPSPSGSTPSPTAAASTSARSAATATPTPDFPPASKDVEHGGEYAAVYLAVSRVDASGQPEQPGELDQARRRAAEAGYAQDVATEDVDCGRGAREALRLDPDREYRGVSILFDTPRQAEAFVDAFSGPVVGIAPVTALCLD